METKNQPFISICIASYNYGSYLKDNFEAIKRQKFKNFELIYLDDASNDNSVEVIQSIIQENPQMDIFLKKHAINKGLLQTKSELLELASGKYVMLCDADDWMADDCLEILSQRAKESDADRVISQVYDVDKSGKVLQIQDFAEEPSKWLWNLHHGCLYKREILEQNCIKMQLYPDDVYLTTLVNCYAQKVEWIRKPLYYWLVHNESAGRSLEGKKQNVLLDNFRDMLRFLMEIRNRMTKLEDKNEIELLAIKLYYLQLFHEIKDVELKSKLHLYREFRKIMQQDYSDYYNNVFLMKKGKNPARPYAMRIMRMGVWLEKIHLMAPALCGYHFLNRWMVFDQ